MIDGKLGVVAAGHPDSAAAGLEVLRSGGNAADAAVAAACAAMTAEAALTGVGGGGFALVHSPQGKVELLDFFATAPGKGRSPDDLAKRQVLLQYTVPFRGTTQLFNVGPSSCAVPGMLPGLATLHERHGRLPLKEALSPAIRLAREGATLVEQQDYLHDILAGLLTGTKGMRAIFAPAGAILRAGERIWVPGLAETLEAFASEGSLPFIRGEYARRMSACLEEGAGLLTPEDMATYEVKIREPVSLRYRDHEILSNPLPSSGGTLIAFTLGLLDRLQISKGDEMGRAEALVRALAGTDAAREEVFNTCLRESTFAARFLSPAKISRYLGNTTHISVVDADGLAVSMTSSCGSGSGVVVHGTGIIMNNMGGEEDLNPGGPFSLPPGERLTSMMAPTIARRSGAPGSRLLALGSAGSARLRSAIVQTLVNIIDLGLPAQEAVDRPRIHFDAGTIHLEGGTSAEVAHELEVKGRKVNLWPVIDLYFGGVQIAARCSNDEGLVFDGGADPRRGGVALFA